MAAGRRPRRGLGQPEGQPRSVGGADGQGHPVGDGDDGDPRPVKIDAVAATVGGHPAAGTAGQHQVRTEAATMGSSRPMSHPAPRPTVISRPAG